MLESQGTNYKKLNPLGDGAFGDVFLVEEATTGAIWVSKEIRLSNLDVTSKGANDNPNVYGGEGTPSAASP